MIERAATNIRAQLQQLVTLRAASEAEQHVSMTLSSLRKVHRAAADLKQAYVLLTPRLDSTAAQLLRDQLAGLPREVQRLSDKFESEPYQTTSLDGLRRQIETATHLVNETWSRVAQTQVASQVALLRQIQRLPEMSARAKQLRQLIADLEGAVATTWSKEKLKALDSSLEAARAQVKALPELSPAIEDFLRRIADNQATVADLDVETLRWLKSGDRAKLFRITLAPPSAT